MCITGPKSDRWVKQFLVIFLKPILHLLLWVNGLEGAEKALSRYPSRVRSLNLTLEKGWLDKAVFILVYLFILAMANLV